MKDWIFRQLDQPAKEETDRKFNWFYLLKVILKYVALLVLFPVTVCCMLALCMMFVLGFCAIVIKAFSDADSWQEFKDSFHGRTFIILADIVDFAKCVFGFEFDRFWVESHAQAEAKT